MGRIVMPVNAGLPRTRRERYRGKGRVSNSHRGFTLLELLISLTILSVIVVIVFGALRIGIRAWEKGERELDRRQRQRIVLDLVKRQLASMCVGEVWGRDQRLVLLKGDNKSLEFVSQIPLVPGNRFGMVYVRYSVKPAKGDEGEHLIFSEKNVALLDKKMVTDYPGESDFSELLPGMKSIGFEYLKDRPGEEAALWQKSWDPAADKGVPRAIRVTLEENDEKEPIYVLAGPGA